MTWSGSQAHFDLERNFLSKLIIQSRNTKNLLWNRTPHQAADQAPFYRSQSSWQQSSTSTKSFYPASKMITRPIQRPIGKTYVLRHSIMSTVLCIKDWPIKKKKSVSSRSQSRQIWRISLYLHRRFDTFRRWPGDLKSWAWSFFAGIKPCYFKPSQSIWMLAVGWMENEQQIDWGKIFAEENSSEGNNSLRRGGTYHRNITKDAIAPVSD